MALPNDDETVSLEEVEEILNDKGDNPLEDLPQNLVMGFVADCEENPVYTPPSGKEPPAEGEEVNLDD
jgi:hypothetical protein